MFEKYCYCYIQGIIKIVPDYLFKQDCLSGYIIILYPFQILSKVVEIQLYEFFFLHL